MTKPARLHRCIALVAFAACSTAAARADDIVLANGNHIEGKAQRVGDQVVIDTGGAEMRLAAADVKSITPGPTKLDAYKERLAKADAKSAKDQLALADWCKEQKMADLEAKHLKAVIAIDGDNAAARARLGFIRYGDKWLTDDEYHAARGFVKVGGEWVSQEEVAKRKAAKEAEDALKAHVKRIQAAVAKMQSPRKAVRLDGKLALMDYAEQLGDTHLAQFASQVAAFYNDQWREVRAERDAALAHTTVRATLATLKRPIPTISTSLGGFSTPVTIQLPELSVVSIKTTVDIPMVIELDDE